MVKSLLTCTDVELEVATPAYYSMLSASFKQFLDQTVSPSYLESLPYLPAAECNVSICTICMEDCSPSTKLLQLPCGHAYHRSCASKWFTTRSRRCPLCARVLPMSRSAFNGPVIITWSHDVVMRRPDTVPTFDCSPGAQGECGFIAFLLMMLLVAAVVVTPFLAVTIVVVI